MNKKIKYLFYVLAIILYMAIGIYSITIVTDWITAEYFATLGKKAIDVAKVVANSYHITNDEAAELRQLNFREILEHPANKRFNELFKGNDYSDDFKYAYIAVRLEPDEIKYYVTDKNTEHFGATPGTPLNFLWLIDALINQNNIIKSDDEYYDDINRYSFLRAEDIETFNVKKQTYIVTRDEYGDAITGYVPINSTENDFIGMLGIDINFEMFEKHTDGVRLSFILIFMLPTIILTLTYIIVYLRDRKEARIESNTDPLTSLNNRRFLSDSMPSIIKEHYKNQNNLSVIMLDIDFFKKYNDNYGHQMGDEVLIKISGAVISVLRHANDIACRYGGEEIIIILKNTSSNGAVLVAEKIKTAINELAIEHKYSDVADVVTVSQGIYSAVPFRYDKKTEEHFIACSDKALYKAKNSGRNKYMVYEEHEELS